MLKQRYVIKRTFDVALITELDEELFPDSERVTNQPNSVYWVVWDTWVLDWVGYAAVRPLRATSGDPAWQATAFLSRAGVKPSARRSGLQQRLIKVRLRWCRRHGYKRVMTYVAWGNTKSLRALIKCSFIPFVPVYHWAGDVIYLERNLDKILDQNLDKKGQYT